MSDTKRLLMFVPYSIDQMNNAPKIRAYNMYNALKEEISTILICGDTYKRLLPEVNQVFRREDIDYIYIEALASTMTIFDYIFLNHLKKRGIMLFPFIRDLYWKFFIHRSNSKIMKLRTKRWYWYCERELNYYLKNATALLFPTELMADTIDFPEKYALPPAGDVSRCLNQEIHENKNITFVGGITPKMGIDILMEAMEIVIKDHPDAHCTIVGHGDQWIINKWKNNEYVTFITDKTYEDIPDILSNTYAIVIPMPKIPHNDFAMPVKLFDYMSSGRPVVATNCTAQANFIKENDIGIVTEDKPESLAEGISKLLDNRDLAVRYGRNAFLAIENEHSWKHRARELIKIMEKY